MSPFTVACVQMSSAREFAPNIESAAGLIRRAREEGAELVCTPEISGMFEPKRALHQEKATEEAQNPFLAAMRDLAKELKLWVLIGSTARESCSSTTC